jgi:hypothetical protein
MLASGAPGRSSCTAMRFSAVWPVEGRRPEPKSAIRSPPRISRAPSASVSRSARSSFSGQISRERHFIDAEPSRHSHTLCAAAHSVSGSNSRSRLADCRQSMRWAESPM